MVVFAGPPRCLQNRVFYNGFCYFTFPFFDPSRLFSCCDVLVFCCCTRFAWEVSKFAKSHLHFRSQNTGPAKIAFPFRRDDLQFLIFVFSPLPAVFRFFFVVVTVSRERCRHLQNRIFIFYCKTQGEPKWLLRFVETICDFLFSFFHPS